MRIRFFDDMASVAKLNASALSWVGTPFFPFARTRGGGVDCVNLAAALYVEAGFLNDFEMPKYTMDRGVHHAESALEAFLDLRSEFQKLQPSEQEAMPGDLLTFRIGKAAHHCGVLVDGTRFVHVYQLHNVQFGDLRDDTWKSRWASIYRPVV